MSNEVNILIVEDNNINRKIISSMIRSIGFIPIEAENGREALILLQTTSVSYILMDLLMPVMDGKEATKEIRKNGLNVPIIAISADQYSSLTPELKSLGFNDVLSKPIDKDELLKTLYRVNESIESNVVNYKIFSPRDFEEFLTDPELRKEIASTFVNEQPHDTKKLTAAFDSKDIDKIYNAVHYMKGSFSYVKASSLFDLSKEILDVCKKNDLDTVFSYKDELFKKYNQLLTEIQFYLNSL